MYLSDDAENMPFTKMVFLIKQFGNVHFNRKKIIGICLYFEIIEAANYAYTLKAVWIKSNVLSNYQATSKGRIFESSAKCVLGTLHFSPVEVKQSTGYDAKKTIYTEGG